MCFCSFFCQQLFTTKVRVLGDDFSSLTSRIVCLQFLKLEIDYRAVANYEHYEMSQVWSIKENCLCVCNKSLPAAKCPQNCVRKSHTCCSFLLPMLSQKVIEFLPSEFSSKKSLLYKVLFSCFKGW